MTPADVKDDAFPGSAMRIMDTIYVMQAKPLTHTASPDSLPDTDPTQSPGPHVPHATVDSLRGDTHVYQLPEVSRQWYSAVEQDAAQLRAACGAMQSTIARQRETI